MRLRFDGYGSPRGVRRVRRDCAGGVGGVLRRLRRDPPLKGGREAAHSVSSGVALIGLSAPSRSGVA